MRKILGFCLLCFVSILLPAQEKRPEIAMPGLEPTVKEHLNQVLDEMYRTKTGKFVLNHVSPGAKIQVKPLVAQWGNADHYNVITLEALRLENKTMTAVTDSQKKTQICFTAEILAHELTHNAQMKNGLFQYPENISGSDAVICEMLLELQAKLTGEKVFQEVRRLEENKSFVGEKPGLLLTMQFMSKDPEKEYIETIWRNQVSSRLYHELIVEMRQWNRAYVEQGFRNNRFRFAMKTQPAPQEQVKAQIEKIIQFSGMPVTADFILTNSSVRPASNGIDYYEDGKKVRHYEVK